MKARIPKGMGGAQDMNSLIKQAKKMQDDMAAMQAELEEREYEVSAGGGMVNLKINGRKEVVSMEIDPEIVDPDDTETLADVIIAAVNEGIKRVEAASEAEMSRITGGMSGFPGMF